MPEIILHTEDDPRGITSEEISYKKKYFKLAPLYRELGERCANAVHAFQLLTNKYGKLKSQDQKKLSAELQIEIDTLSADVVKLTTLRFEDKINWAIIKDRLSADIVNLHSAYEGAKEDTKDISRRFHGQKNDITMLNNRINTIEGYVVESANDINRIMNEQRPRYGLIQATLIILKRKMGIKD